jgi:exodeoxyribonuclease VIII
VRNAKFIIESRDPAWRAWTTSYRTVPGILEIPRGELWAIMADGYKNLKLIEDADSRRDYVKSRLWGHPMLPDFGDNDDQDISAHESNVVEIDKPGLKSLGGGRFDVSEIFDASPLASLSDDESAAPQSQDAPSNGVEKTETVSQSDAVEEQQPATASAYFEPGRYLSLSNDAYHAANGISSTMLKDARVSLMYYNARHVAKTIKKEKTKFLDMGNLVHTLALEPEKLDQEFSIEPVIPAGAFTSSASMREFIDKHNASLPATADIDVLKSMLEAHNATLPAPYALGGNVDEIGQFYTLLPTEYQTIPEGQKFTATLMKACIKAFNATLPEPLKISGSREALLEQLATIEPEWVEEERALPLPLAVSGSKDEMAARIRSVKPDAVFADELLDNWRNADDARIQVTLQQMEEATAIQQALFNHPSAGPMIKHAQRTVEASYFGFDEDTGLEIRVRPDLEIDLDGVRLGFDRDYHLSAAMYSDVAAFDQFFWIFVNKDEGYNWVAIVEASTDLLELGRLEYKKTMRDIQHALDTGVWPAPITDEFTDELNDFDQRRLEALRLA